MPQIGTDRISQQQQSLLERARANRLDAFHRLTQDDDIIGNREQVHPDWQTLFEEKKDLLRSASASRQFETIRSFFAALKPFDEGIIYLDPTLLSLSFLLGAGASKPQPSNIPTVTELLPELLERGRRLDRDDVTKLADFCESRKIDNIEDLLTAAQVATFCSRNPSILQLVNYLLYGGDSQLYDAGPGYVAGGELIRRRLREPAADLSSVAFLQDTLQVLFELLSSTMLPAKPNPAHEAIASYAKDHRGSTIVTTNYDCCMDLALGEVKDFDYRLEFANLGRENTVQTEARTRLIKLHGSLNWFYCETCQEVQLLDIRQMVGNFLEDKAPYPVIGICRSCGGQSRGLLVPPLAMKFDLAPPLTPLSAQANEAFDTADAIIVVGFSFADADLYVGSYVSRIKMVLPSGELVEVTDDQPELMQKIRSSYGTFGIVCEATLRVRPIQPLEVHHETFSLDDFVKKLPELKAGGDSLMFNIFPFENLITVEFRRYNPGASGIPNRFSWPLRNYMWANAGPAVCAQAERDIADPDARYKVIDGLNKVWRFKLENLIKSDYTIATDQIIRYPAVANASRYTFSLWAFAEDMYPTVLAQHFQFCQNYYKSTGYRVNMLYVGYRVAQDQNSLLSYSYDGNVMTMDPVSTGNAGWTTFLRAYNQSCSDRGGVPLFNQTFGANRAQAQKALGARLQAFADARKTYDPNNRLLNSYFSELLAESQQASAG